MTSINRRVATLFLSGILMLCVGFFLTNQNKEVVSWVQPSSTPSPNIPSQTTPQQHTLGETTTSSEGMQKITVVRDGDTVETEEKETIRYLGINTPEKGQPYAQEATEENTRLVLNKLVRLEYDVQAKDRYGRTLAFVFVGDTFVNLELVRKGLAISETIPPNVKFQDQIVAAQKQAREECLGLWKGLCSNAQLDIENTRCISITEIHADASGSDNANKNGEWIGVKNSCTQSQALTNWLIKDNSASNSFRFPQFSLNPQTSVRIYSGCGVNSKTDLYWKCPEGQYAIWNNTADHAFLYNEKDELEADYQY